MDKRISSALVLMGFTSLIVQTLLIREFFVTFYGNELTIGLVLACWIISEGLGSSIVSRISNIVKRPFLSYASLQILIALYLPLSIYLIRGAKNFMAPVPGEAVGIIPVILSSLIIISPLSIFDGMQFSFGYRIYRDDAKRGAESAGRVYILEGMGFIIAGPVLTYILLTRLDSFQIVFAIGLLNLASGLFLMKREVRSLLKRLLTAAIYISMACGMYLLLSGSLAKIHNRSVAMQWKNQEIVEYRNSPYGNLAVARSNEQYTFYNDGIPIINTPVSDAFWTTDFINFAMLNHPAPKKILFLSGGIGGPINEILKYPVASIDYAELDPLLIGLVKKFPGPVTEKELADKRVSLKIIDGVRFVKTASARNLEYDMIFINLPLPSTLQLNRYYTKEFFVSLKAILDQEGYFVLSVPGSLTYMNEELRELNLCVLETLKAVFPDTYCIPGDNTNIYLASLKPVTFSTEALLKQIKHYEIPENILTRQYLEYRLSPEPQEWFYKELGKGRSVKQNSDLAPAAVFYSIEYWDSIFEPDLQELFDLIKRINLRYVTALVALLYLVLLFIKKAGKRMNNIGISMSIATTGFFGMGFYIIFMLSYQAFFGYVYHHIALLVAAFMAGLVIGGWLVTNNLKKIKAGLGIFLGIETTVILFSAASLFLLNYLNGLENFSFYPLFYILPLVSGTLVGAEFPLANKLYKDEKKTGKTAGMLYGLDLFGGFFAALLIPMALIPLCGILQVCLLIIAIKALGFILYL